MSSTISVYSWTDEIEAIQQRSIWADAVERFRNNWMAVASLCFTIFLLLASVVGPLVSPWPYTLQDLHTVSQAPTSTHWLGTDSLGRDYLTRIMMGGRTAFFVAIF